MTEQELTSIVAIGLSADGIGAIRTTLGALPAGLASPIVAVMHRGPQQHAITCVIAFRSLLVVRAVGGEEALRCAHPLWMSRDRLQADRHA